MIILESDTQDDLVMLDTVDFDVVLGIYWLLIYHMVLYYFSKIVTLALLAYP